MPATLDSALAERTRLEQRAKAAKRAEMLELYADPLYGEWLRRFVATLNYFRIEHGDRFVEYVESECRKWLAAAPLDIRFAALQAVSARCMRIRESAGLAVLDDPLPGDTPDVYRICREAIGL